MLASDLGSDHPAGTIELSRETDNIVVLSLEGEFDMANAAWVSEHIDRALDTDHVVIDLSPATFIDSSIINVLVHTAGFAESRGRAAVVKLSTSEIVERVVQLSGVEQFLPRVHTREQAMELIHQHILSGDAARK